MQSMAVWWCDEDGCVRGCAVRLCCVCKDLQTGACVGLGRRGVCPWHCRDWELLILWPAVLLESSTQPSVKPMHHVNFLQLLLLGVELVLIVPVLICVLLVLALVGTHAEAGACRPCVPHSTVLPT